MATQSIKHVLLRYSDNTSPREGTIFHHTQIIKEHSSVWMGKFGKPLSQTKISLLSRQLHDDKPTHIFLVKKEAGGYDVTAGDIKGVANMLSKEDMKKVPEYYRENTKNVGTWFNLAKLYKVDNSILRNIIIASSGMPASRTLPYSMAGFFLVRLDSSVSLQDFKKKS